MQMQYTQMLAGLRQVQGFLDDNAAVVGTLDSGGGRRGLDDATAQLASLANEQGVHRTQGTGALASEKQLARALRRKHMWPIVKVARAKLPELANLEAVRMPSFRSNNTDLALRAGQMADTVQPYAAQLQDGGLTAGFLDRLRAATAELLDAIASKGRHQSGRLRSTDGIRKVVARARRAVGVVDALVRAQLGETEPLLTEWASIVRTIRNSASRLTGPNPADPAQAPSSGTAAAPTGAPALSPPSTAPAAGGPASHAA
jgi:hypothetical protein